MKKLLEDEKSESVKSRVSKISMLDNPNLEKINEEEEEKFDASKSIHLD